MERKITYNGKLIKVSELDLPEELWERMYLGFYNVSNLRQFGQELGFSERAITVLFEDYLEKLQEEKEKYITDSPIVQTVIGAKTIPYFNNEEEISNHLHCNYTWEDLTLHEKRFYLNYGKKPKQRCFLRKRDETSDSENTRI